jgi:hypothetical protein
LSIDNVNWSQTLVDSPFSNVPTLWVPGDSISGTIYVASTACAAPTGTVTVTYLGTGKGGADFADNLVVTETLNGAGPYPGGTTFAIQGNTSNAITITVTYPYGSTTSGDSTNEDMTQQVDGLAAVVNLACTDPTAPVPPIPSASSSPGASPGASTGTGSGGTTQTIALPAAPTVPAGTAPVTSSPGSGAAWVINDPNSTVTAYDSTADIYPIGTGKVSILPPKMQVSVPSTVSPGESMDFAGTGFNPGDTLTVVGPDGRQQTITVGPDGSISGSLTIPDSFAPGSYTVTITDPTTGMSTTVPVTVVADGSTSGNASTLTPAPSVTISQQGIPGSSLAVVGSNYPPNSTVTIVIPGSDPGDPGTTIDMAVDALGSIHGSIPLPSGLAPGDYTLIVTNPAGPTSTPVTVTVLNPDGSTPSSSPTPTLGGGTGSSTSSPSSSPAPSGSPTSGGGTGDPSAHPTTTPSGSGSPGPSGGPGPSDGPTSSPASCPAAPAPVANNDATETASVASILIAGEPTPGGSIQVAGTGFAPGATATVTINMPGVCPQ